MITGRSIPLKSSIATRLLLVVVSLYLLVAAAATITTIWIEYRYQKHSLINELSDIESAFSNGLAVSMWGLNKSALQASVEGMLKIPTVTGVSIHNSDGDHIALAGIVKRGDITGGVGKHVNLFGCSDKEKMVHDDELYTYEVFEHHFPIKRMAEGKEETLGEATIYSNSSVIYRRMKLQIASQSVNVILTLITFSIALLWAVNRYLRTPLHTLISAAGNISLGNLESFRIDTKSASHNEIKVLEETLNSMIGDLHCAIMKGKKDDEEKKALAKRVHLQQEAVIKISEINPLDHPIHSVMAMITQETALGIDVERLSIWLFNDKHDKLLCQDLFVSSDREHSKGLVLEMASYPSYATAVETLKCIAADDAQNDPRTSEFSEHYLAPLGISSMLDTPIRMKRGVVGVVCLEHVGLPRTWTDDESVFAERIADQIASFLSEVELEENREHLSKAQEIAHLGSWEFNILNNELLWSDEVFRIFGFEPQAFTPTYGEFLAGIHPEDREKVSQAYTNSIRAGERQYEIEHRIVQNHTDEVRYLHEKCTHIRDDEGKAVRSIGMVHDVTERKQAELQLRKLRNYLSNIINSMPSVLVGIDPDGVVTQWNVEAEKSTGIKNEDALGKHLDKLMTRFASDMTNIKKAINTKTVYSKGKQSYSLGGHTIYEDLTVYPLIADGVQGAVIRIDNVSERVQLENMMVQSEKMQSVGGLAAGMAHEINNPLAAITQGIQNVLRRLDPSIVKNVEAAREFGVDLDVLHEFLEDRKILTFLEGGREAVDRAAKIVRNMLQFSRKSDSSIAPTSLEELVEHAIELGSTDYDMKKKYDFKFIDIIREYDSELGDVNCCPPEIEQVLLNLFKNALQAMEEIVEENYKPQFHVRLVKEPDYARIEIEDNGPGISEHVMSRIFEPFFTTKPAGVGTGLGLSVSYMIITQNHGGTFEVESEAAKGSKFIIRLPVS